MPRLFACVPLPDPVRDVLSSIGGGVRNARWTDYDQLHLTLVFIGEVPGAQIDRLVAQLRGIEWQAIDIHIRDLGHFPGRGAPKVLWAGVQLTEALSELERRCVRAIQAADITVQPRKYHPHVTVARLNRAPIDEVAQFLQNNSGLDFPVFSVNRFELWQSHLAPEGASYSVVAALPAR